MTVTPSGQVMMPDREDQQRREAAGAQGIDHYAWIKGFWTYENGHWACPFEWEAPANETNRIGGHWGTNTGRLGLGAWTSLLVGTEGAQKQRRV